MIRQSAKRAMAIAAIAAAASLSSAAMLTFNSTAPANNAATRQSWLDAIGVSAGDYFADFENIPLDTNIHGVTGLLPGGLTMYDTATAHSLFVRGSSSYFGNSNPIGTRAVAHSGSPWLELDFSANPMDYVGGYDIDNLGSTVRVTFVDDTFASFNLESTNPSGDSAEFWGVFRNDKPKIKKVAFDPTNEWGIDNIEYGPVPEPATLLVLAPVLLFFRRRSH